MRQPRIVVTESRNFSSRAATRLRSVGDLVLANLDRRGLLVTASEADVLWVRLGQSIDTEVFAAARNLKMIVTATTGLDHVDVEEAARRGVEIVSLRGETEFLKEIRATAEHTIALILALLRKLPAAVAHVDSGGWDRDLFRGRELYGKTAGVVGYGRLGRRVAHYLKAFDMRVLVADRGLVAADVEEGVVPVSLAELLSQADLVTLHVSATPETRGLIGRAAFRVMKRGAWLINTSRGQMIDEGALLEALQSGHLAGAALDVLSGEWSDSLTDVDLIAYSREHDNLLITPHIGGCTVESMEKTEFFLAERVLERLAAARSHASVAFALGDPGAGETE